MPSCCTSWSANPLAPGPVPACSHSTITTTRKIAIGSFAPDSISSVASTRSLERLAAVAQRAEDRGGIGRPDDRAEQQRIPPVEIEQPDRAGRHGGRGEQHTECRERKRGLERDAECPRVGAQTAVEEDHGKSEIADEERGLVVVEQNAAGTILTCEHADAEEDEQERKAEARGDQRREHTREQQASAQQKKSVGRHALNDTRGRPRRRGMVPASSTPVGARPQVASGRRLPPRSDPSDQRFGQSRAEPAPTGGMTAGSKPPVGAGSARDFP